MINDTKPILSPVYRHPNRPVSVPVELVTVFGTARIVTVAHQKHGGLPIADLCRGKLMFLDKLLNGHQAAWEILEVG